MSFVPLTRRLGLGISRISYKRTIASTSRSQLPRSRAVPWFVEEPSHPSPPHVSDSPSTSSPKYQNHNMTPPPPEAPEPLHVLFETLSTLPVIDSVSISSSSTYLDSVASGPLDAELPRKRPQGKRARRSSSFGGEGLGDPPPPWDWVLSARVKPGSEKKGSVTIVLDVVRKTVSFYCISGGSESTSS